MSTTKKCVKSYLTHEEYAAVQALAVSSGLSVSAFVKSVCLNYPIRSITDRDAILTLIGIKGNLGRIGGLLKHYLGQYRHNVEVRNFLKNIEADKKRLDEDLKQVVEVILKAGKR